LSDDRETEFPEENIGLLAPTNRNYTPKKGGSASWSSVPATYQQILYMLEAGVLAATPVADGAGTDFIYTYPGPLGSIPTIQTFTMEGGDNQQFREMPYAFCSEFTIEGAAGEALQMSSEWMGQTPTKTTKTPALTVPAVEEILTSKGKLYLDTPASGFGTTQITNTLLSFSLSYTTGIIAKWTVDGTLEFSFHQSVRPELSLSVVFEHNTSAVAEQDLWELNSPRALQLIFEGSAFATTGTTYTYHTLQMDIAGAWENFESLGEQDGNSTVAATFKGGYDATLAKFFDIIVANELAALP
jgi:hypothetical protein